MSGINNDAQTIPFLHFPYTAHLEDGPEACPAVAQVSVGLCVVTAVSVSLGLFVEMVPQEDMEAVTVVAVAADIHVDATNIISFPFTFQFYFSCPEKDHKYIYTFQDTHIFQKQ